MAYFEVRGISKSFGSVSVLKGIDFSLEQGQVVSIIGSSGSGKTTLLRCINFLEDADDGQFYFDGELLYDVRRKRALSAEELRAKRKNFGLVFQQFNLFPQYSVKDNLCLAPKLRLTKEELAARGKRTLHREIEAHADELLAQVGLSAKAASYPCELSGGQQQRVAIARALMLEPKILCFDEPTSALDPELTGEVLRVIKELAGRNTTMIVVTHEMKFAGEISDKIVFMDDGIIAEEGTPHELFSAPRTERLKAFLANVDFRV